MEKLTRGKIESVVNEIFNQPKKEKQSVKLTQWCDTIGGFRNKFSGHFLNVCENVNCKPCRNLEESFEGALKDVLRSKNNLFI